MIKLGQEVRDRVTGFQGIVVVIADHLYGCVRIGVQPQGMDKDGRKFDDAFFDVSALEVISEGITAQLAPKPSIQEKAAGRPPGGPDRERPGREHY